MTIDKLTSSIINDVQAGLAGYNANLSLSELQLADEVVEEREAVVRELWLKGILRKSDLLQSINCIQVDCADMNKCPCIGLKSAKNARHFEIPPTLEAMGSDAIDFIGSVDRSNFFNVYSTKLGADYHKYKRRNSSKPYVYIDHTVNDNGMYDCWLFGAPFVTNLSVVGVFRDPRQLEEFDCCGTKEEREELGSISSAVKERLTKKKLQYYKQFYPNPMASNLIPR